MPEPKPVHDVLEACDGAQRCADLPRPHTPQAIFQALRAAFVAGVSPEQCLLGSVAMSRSVGHCRLAA
jgi:hypothetical protein